MLTFYLGMCIFLIHYFSSPNFLISFAHLFWVAIEIHCMNIQTRRHEHHLHIATIFIWRSLTLISLPSTACFRCLTMQLKPRRWLRNTSLLPLISLSGLNKPLSFWTIASLLIHWLVCSNSYKHSIPTAQWKNRPSTIYSPYLYLLSGERRINPSVINNRNDLAICMC